MRQDAAEALILGWEAEAALRGLERSSHGFGHELEAWLEQRLGP